LLKVDKLPQFVDTVRAGVRLAATFCIGGQVGAAKKVVAEGADTTFRQLEHIAAFVAGKRDNLAGCHPLIYRPISEWI
jgi:hypothetical protein